MGLYVYILLCADGSYYTGVTNDVEGRFEDHSQGLDPDSYTYSRRPVTVVWGNYFNGILEAISWEKRIKGWSRKKKEALISGQYELLPAYSACKNASTSKRLSTEEFLKLKEERLKGFHRR